MACVAEFGFVGLQLHTSGHIIICDDEPDIRDMIGEYLQRHGYTVSGAENGEALRAMLVNENPDLVILDVSMPGEDGLSLARFLRDRSRVGIIMLTGASDLIDRIIGLEMGADDYLGKPVDLRELLARIKAVLRRAASDGVTGEQGGRSHGEDNRIFSFGACRLDLDAGALYGPDGLEMPLTAMEYSLLKVFAAHPGRVLNRDQLLEMAHDRNWDPYDRSIDIRISRLRRKIEANPKKPAIIRTVRGLGYLFDPDAD
jgi:two-component system phosphate regulon response regulator OmpR